MTSLVQTATGFNHAEGRAAGTDGPKELPAQALDHASGYLMAFGTMMARARQSHEGGSWHVRISLAQTGRWLWNLGRIADGLQASEFGARYGGTLRTRPSIRIRPASFGYAFGGVIENTGVLGPAGDAARQPSRAMAGARVTIEPQLANFH